MSRYYLGIDGGGTKTRAVIVDHTGNVMGTGESGPSSIDTVSLDISRENILQSIINTGVNTSTKLSGIFAGLGGVVSETDKKKVINLISSMKICDCIGSIHVENDAFAAMYGGLALANEGISIIIGTGSVAFGINEKGDTWRSGGYGYKEGDPGSSYYLGRQLLKYVAKVLDGRIEPSAMLVEVCQELRISDANTFITKLDELHDDRTQTAQLARYVTKFATDPVAKHIIDTATDELALMVYAVYTHLNIKQKKLAIIGSLGNESVFCEVFTQKIHTIHPEFEVFRAILDPALGSALRALQLGGIPITERILDTVQKTK
ncbi:MAG: hypothetical protein INQ03_11480 [Candidatus Heimdallarchaeota archaeon]|nr:hypothetical protein [Candidatus Heimdallarchaeota archaeon]